MSIKKKLKLPLMYKIFRNGQDKQKKKNFFKIQYKLA